MKKNLGERREKKENERRHKMEIGMGKEKDEARRRCFDETHH